METLIYESDNFLKDDNMSIQVQQKMAQVDTEDIKTTALKRCREYLNGAWKEVTENEFIIKRVSGGLSNLLYHCCLPDTLPPRGNEPKQVLLRIYGHSQGDRVLETHLTECIIFTMLAEKHRGPRLYGVFPGGRLEQYIPGRALVTDELGNFSLSIAESVAEIHGMQVPLLKEPRWLWDTMNGWLEHIEHFISQGKKNSSKENMINKLVQYRLKEESIWMKKYLKFVHSPVLFCHNDLQEGNIMLKSGTSTSMCGFTDSGTQTSRHKLVVIDFEYCSYNYRGFDLANHFCEYIYDYSNESFPYFWAKYQNYPNLEEQKNFVRKYLQVLHKEENVKDDEINMVIKEIKAFTLASHFFWGLWSVVNATNSTITFDYWGYGEERFNAYFKQKTLLLEEKKIQS